MYILVIGFMPVWKMLKLLRMLLFDNLKHITIWLKAKLSHHKIICLYSSQSAEVMKGATSHQGNLATSLDSFANEIRNSSNEGIKTAEKLNDESQQLGSSMLVLCQESSQWCETTEGTVDMLSRDQLSFYDLNKRQLRNVEQV